MATPPGLGQSPGSLVPPSSPKSRPRICSRIPGFWPGLLDFGPGSSARTPRNPARSSLALHLFKPVLLPGPEPSYHPHIAGKATVTPQGPSGPDPVLYIHLFCKSPKLFKKNLKFESQALCPQAKDVAEELEGVSSHLGNSWRPPD